MAVKVPLEKLYEDFSQFFTAGFKDPSRDPVWSCSFIGFDIGQLSAEFYCYH
jgi:hypothetical protein